MPEEKQDPANTQMFRAFVERGEQESTTNYLAIILAIGASGIVIALIAAFVLL